MKSSGPEIATVQPLDDGVRFTGASGIVIVIDTAAGSLRIRGRRGLRAELAATRAGVSDAARFIARALRLGVGASRSRCARFDGDPSSAAPPPAQQPDLFATGPLAPIDDVDEGADGVERRVGDALEGALRRRAVARWALDTAPDALCAAVDAVDPTPLLWAPALAAHHYLARDAVRLRAAAAALALVERTIGLWERPACIEGLLAPLAHWSTLFSHEGRASRAVHKTLALHGEDARVDDLWALRSVRLIGPVKSALHLMVLGDRVRAGPGVFSSLGVHLRLIQLVDEDELRALVEETAAQLLQPHAALETKAHLFGELLARVYPPRTDAGAPGLRARVRDHFRVATTRGRVLHAEAPAARPPIALPGPASIRFLKTVGEIIGEGRRMGHCIGTRAASAVRGDAFLFHVEHGGASASVEVAHDGVVREVSGPGNTHNRACAWAEAELEAWGRRLDAHRRALAGAEQGAQT